MKKIIYDGQEFEKCITSTNDKIEVNNKIINAICYVGQNLSHEIYEVGEIDDNIDLSEAIEKWMKVYFEDVQDGSIKYVSYLSDNMVCGNKIIQNYVCEIEYSVMWVDDIGYLYNPAFKLKSKINIHTEF